MSQNEHYQKIAKTIQSLRNTDDIIFYRLSNLFIGNNILKVGL